MNPLHENADLLCPPRGMFAPFLQNQPLHFLVRRRGTTLRTEAPFLQPAATLAGMALQIFMPHFAADAKVTAQVRDRKSSGLFNRAEANPLAPNRFAPYLLTALKRFPEDPRKLIHLSEDEEEAELLRCTLDSTDGETFRVNRIATLEELKDENMYRNCDAVLLDMRMDRNQSLSVIQWVAASRSRTSLIALCRDHQQLEEYREVIHDIDDYILADHLVAGELSTRITHAIRRRLREHALLREEVLLRSLLSTVPSFI